MVVYFRVHFRSFPYLWVQFLQRWQRTLVIVRRLVLVRSHKNHTNLVASASRDDIPNVGLDVTNWNAAHQAVNYHVDVKVSQ